ncbi:FAD-dependent monooxygenase [Rhodococcus rhodochrous]|uniref:FAD-dependent monooxygenase n=1 Tax=Rhodococcus rhodochrous TaxID=1829 RepID=UPI000316DB76|nr:FAD-dependent monooxygenase [Rhodococcus rhodochrous]
MADVETPVLIVGAGPAGLTAALALAKFGIEHVLVEKYPGTAHSPRAHIVNPRTVEIMRHLGIQDEIEAVSAPHERLRHHVWYTTLNQPEIARREAWGTSPHRKADYLTASPCPSINCPQTRFEPVLVDAVRKAGSDVQFQRELVSTKRDGDHWVSTIRNREDESTYTIRSRYVIGADGARTKMLGFAGLDIEGPSGLFHAANIWFKADLSRYLAHRPGVLTWNMYPGPQPPLALGTFICMNPFDEFVLNRFYDPEVEDLSEMTEEQAIRHVERAVGEPVDDIEILGISGWKVNAQIAPEYARDGVFCMGDAVHRHPPTNGLGLNMSVADAYNLAWKLALVLRGEAGPELLDTYNSERQPIGATGVDRAIRSLHQATAIQEAVGLHEGLSEEEGWQALASLKDPGPLGDERRAALRAALDKNENRFNALGLEVGYHYDTGALVHDETPYPPFEGDPVLDFQTTTRPGARVPHARLIRNGAQISTLDLIDGLEFALLVGLDAEHWFEAAEKASVELGVKIVAHQIGGDDILDPYWEWIDAREVGHAGAVLVRPDRHIAWRSVDRPADATAELTRVMKAVLSV